MAQALTTLGEGQQQFSAMRRVPAAAAIVAFVTAMNLACLAVSLIRG